jgi:nicotinic acetylcholine receptor
MPLIPSIFFLLPFDSIDYSADGEYVVTTMTKAILHYDGHVKWYQQKLIW